MNGGRLRVPPHPEHDLACCRLPLTDLGNAERWRVRFGRDFRFCAEIGWFAWDTRRWKLLSEEKDSVPAEVIWSITCTVRAIRNEAALVAASGCEDPEDLGPAQKHKFAKLSQAVFEEGYDRYRRDVVRSWTPDQVRGDEEGKTAELERWLEELGPLDMLVDLSKDKLVSTTLRSWAKQSEGAKTVGAVVRWIKGFRDIVVRPEAFDRDRMAINVDNGTLRLVPNRMKLSAAEQEERARAASSTEGVGPTKKPTEWVTRGWKLKRFPHERADLITKLAPVKYAPSARCPAYDSFLARVQPDETMRRFIHQWGGYSLTGDIGEHKLAFFYGQGRNGKGTWVELVAHLAGDYAGSIGIDSLAEQDRQRRGDQATPDIARLPGVRFLRVSEPKKGMSWNDGLLKQLTGGDPVDARHLHKSFFTFLPDFKITVSGNNKPRGRDITHGFWARMQLVPWDETIPEDEIDTELGERLRGEASGVLNRLIDGLLDWHESGLIVPEQVREATRAYRDDSDDLGRFLSAVCELGPTEGKARVQVPAGELYELYTAWAAAAGGGEWKIKGFKGAMEDKGFRQIQSDGNKWIGLRVKPGVTLEDVKRGVWPGVVSPSAPSGVEQHPDDWAPPEEGL